MTETKRPVLVIGADQAIERGTSARITFKDVELLPWEGEEVQQPDYQLDEPMVEKLLERLSWLKGQEVAQKNAAKTRASQLKQRVAYCLFAIAPSLDKYIKARVARASVGKRVPARSVALGAGKIALRKVPAKFTLHNPQSVIDWSLEHDPDNEREIRGVHLVHENVLAYLQQNLTSEQIVAMGLGTVSVKPVKVEAWFTATGEVPPGCTFDKEHDISVLDFGTGLGTFKVEGWSITPDEETGDDSE